MSRPPSSAIIVFVASLLFGTASPAAPLQIPTTFVPGTPAKASEVNANFAAAASAVNAHDRRLTSLLSSATGGFTVKVGATEFGTVIFEAINDDGYASPLTVFNRRGFLVELATGTVDSPISSSSVIASPLLEGSLFPERILFTAPNCTGTAFVSLTAGAARQGIVFGNPNNLRVGYYAQGTPSPMMLQSVLVYEHLGASFGSPETADAVLCSNADSDTDFPFQPRVVLGVVAKDNDPQITGVPNNLSGPITFTITR